MCELSLVAASGGFSFAMASLVVEHRLWEVWTQ